MICKAKLIEKTKTKSHRNMGGTFLSGRFENGQERIHSMGGFNVGARTPIG